GEIGDVVNGNVAIVEADLESTVREESGGYLVAIVALSTQPIHVDDEICRAHRCLVRQQAHAHECAVRQLVSPRPQCSFHEPELLAETARGRTGQPEETRVPAGWRLRRRQRENQEVAQLEVERTLPDPIRTTREPLLAWIPTDDGVPASQRLLDHTRARQRAGEAEHRLLSNPLRPPHELPQISHLCVSTPLARKVFCDRELFSIAANAAPPHPSQQRQVLVPVRILQQRVA